MAGKGRPPVARDSTQISLRVSEEWLMRADAIAEAFAVDGFRSDRASVWRAALGIGLTALEEKHGLTKRKAKR
jgi:hypothetical protein